MFDRLAFIGDVDLVFPLRTLGIRVFSPKTIDEARRILTTLEEKKVALCFVHEKYFEALTEEREALQKKFCPVVVEFSDYRKVIDRLDEKLREMAIKATGSDSLVKRRG